MEIRKKIKDTFLDTTDLDLAHKEIGYLKDLNDAKDMTIAYLKELLNIQSESIKRYRLLEEELNEIKKGLEKRGKKNDGLCHAGRTGKGNAGSGTLVCGGLQQHFRPGGGPGAGPELGRLLPDEGRKADGGALPGETRLHPYCPGKGRLRHGGAAGRDGAGAGRPCVSGPYRLRRGVRIGNRDSGPCRRPGGRGAGHRQSGEEPLHCIGPGGTGKTGKGD